MKPVIHPYLFFAGRCEEAVDFYVEHLGAERLMQMRYKEAPDQTPETVETGSGEKIMHASFKIGDSLVMASDACGGCGADETVSFEGFTLSLTMPDETQARRAFDVLAGGGSIRMPLGPTFWSPCFGMVEDRFGIAWMVTVPGANE